MKIIAITQARVGSGRLHAKVLKTINGKSLLQSHIERAGKSTLIQKLIVATTVEPDAIKICDLCDELGVPYYRGSVDNVLDRFYQIGRAEKPDYIVRITSDCPLIDPRVIDAVIEPCVKGGYDYASNTIKPTFPDGIDVEVFSFRALEAAWKEAALPSEREHVTPYIWKNAFHNGGNLFNSYSLELEEDYSSYRLTVDEPKDFELIKILFENLGDAQQWKEYVDFIKSHDELFDINSSIGRNEGYIKSVQNDIKIN